MFKKVNLQMNLPKLEEEILKFWQDKKIFEKSIEIRKDAKEYVFYDGPPFATGTPHYGHIVASTMKDVVPRYWTMNGYKVERKWGWDCHGLPIENITEKELGIKSKKQIEEEIGIKAFNDYCRTKVLGYVEEWKKVIRRLGRWADMENAYQTMDLKYMESVWWVVKQLWEKSLIYEGYRSMHICPRCETTLSQSEVSEGYKDVTDISLTAKFQLIDEPDCFILAWTTTPWTLIGNVALAINKSITYSKIELENNGSKEFLILAKERIKQVVGEKKYRIVKDIPTKKLIGARYRPLFSYYINDNKIKNRSNGWKVVGADFVTAKEGTGIVHIAPAFGEDDMNLARALNLPFIQHIGVDGLIKDEAKEFSGLHVKPQDDVTKTDVEIIKYLAKKDLLFSKQKYQHSYPHCWRCDTPLLNYATSSWFVAVEKIKDKLIKEAKKIKWSPKHIKEGRFGKWLEGAQDWSISRQRFWGSVLPIWKCQCGEIYVVGSVLELEKLSGKKINDLHKDIVDDITFKCKKCDQRVKRIPDVLDCWFESGSMPYAQMHYPFENKKLFERNFPAEFIAEGIDQTRAWFYYLHVLSSALFDTRAYNNVVVNGIVLAEDGKKMAKRLQNYPDPIVMFNRYGADVMRMYLMSSPVVSAENLNFKEKELSEISRGIFRMLWNTYYFFILYGSIDKIKQKDEFVLDSANILDKWIISELNILISDIRDSMSKYDLTKATRLFQPFIDNLSNWYIRRSRKRFWKSENDKDKKSAYETLHYVLTELSKLLAPFAPFLSEEIFRNLTANESVHLKDYPQRKDEFIDRKLSYKMQRTRKIVELGLKARADKKVKVRQPLSEMEYYGTKIEKEMEEIIANEVNVKKIIHSKNTENKNDEVKINFTLTPKLIKEGLAREIIRAIQELRKNSGLAVENRIILYYWTKEKIINDVFVTEQRIISEEILSNRIIKSGNKEEISGKIECIINNMKLWIGIKRENV